MKKHILILLSLVIAAVICLGACSGQSQQAGEGTKTADSSAANDSVSSKIDVNANNYEHDFHIDAKSYLEETYNKLLDYMEGTNGFNANIYSDAKIKEDKLGVSYIFATDEEKLAVRKPFSPFVLDGKFSITTASTYQEVKEAGYQVYGNETLDPGKITMDMIPVYNNGKTFRVRFLNYSSEQQTYDGCGFETITFGSFEDKTVMQNSSVSFNCNGMTNNASFEDVIKAMGTPVSCSFEVKTAEGTGKPECEIFMYYEGTVEPRVYGNPNDPKVTTNDKMQIKLSYDPETNTSLVYVIRCDIENTYYHPN